MPDSVPSDVAQTWQAVGPVLDQRARLISESARTGQLDRAGLKVLDDQFVQLVDAAAALRDVCDAAPDAPLVLLPVRLETRFGTDAAGSAALRVRIYPDEIHVDNLDAGITDDEATAGRAYWAAVWNGTDPMPLEPWGQLVTAVGNARAEWVAHQLTPTNLDRRGAAEGPSFADVTPRVFRGAVARALPDRFVVTAEQGGVVSSQIGAPIPPDLPMAAIAQDLSEPVVTSTGLAMPAGTEWTVDYDQAVAVGMAVTLPLAAGVAPIDRLFVVGVRGSLDPDSGAAELENLLAAHRFSDGLDILPQATPTNNADADRSPWQPRRTPVAPPVTPPAAPAPNTDAATVASVLGVSGTALDGLAHGAGTEQDLARAANTALWGPGWGYFLSRLAGSGLDDAHRQSARDLFQDHVRGRGPSPTVRVGRQPYGVLPVSSLGRWVPRDNERAAMLVDLLRNARRRWLAAAEGVPRVRRGGGAVDGQMLDALGSAPVMQGLRVRPVVADEIADAALAAIGGNRDLYRSELDLTRLLLADVIGTSAASMVVGSLHDDSRPLSLPLVADADAERTATLLAGGTPPISSVLQALLALAWDEVEKAVRQAAPRATLSPLLDQATTLSGTARTSISAVLTTADSEPAQRLHAVADQVVAEVGAGGPALLSQYQPIRAIETSLAEVALAAPLVDEARRLGGIALGAWLRAMARRAEVRDAMQQLVAAPKDQRALVVAETLDLGSHRMDAWVTALVEERRAALASARPRGLTIGAYGVVENISPGAGSAPEGGWIHAPSISHAAAAGMLRSAHLGHLPDDGGAGPFAIDLSSRRVALAKHLLDGVRGGQQLGALVGYRIERSLIDNKLGRFVLSLREIAPLVAGRLNDRDGADSQESKESVAASQVVDGLLLLHQHGRGDDALRARLNKVPENKYLLPGSWTGPDDAEWNQICSALATADDAIDAVADVLLSESIMQHAAGNPARTAATLDVASNGGTAADNPAVLEIQSTGERLTHRVIVAVTGDETGWSTTRPRALAEPRLEAWAARWLGAADQVVVASVGGGTLTLADTGLAALDIVLGSADPVGLEHTVRAALPTLPPDAALAQQRDPAWPAGQRAIGEITTLASSLRALLTAARPLQPADLSRPGVPSTRTLDAALPELIERMRTAAGGLATAAASLAGLLQSLEGQPSAADTGTASAVDAGVQALDAYGMFVPGSASVSLDAARAAAALALSRAAAAQTALNRATAAQAGLVQVPPEATPELVIEAAEEVARAVFGEGFRVVPVLSAPDATDEFAAAVDRPSFVAPTPPRVRRFIRDLASVRKSVQRLAEVLLIGDVFGRAKQPMVVQISETGAPGTDHWLGGPLAAPSVWPNRPVAHVLIDAGDGFSGTARIGGLVVDAWVEMLPAQPGPKGGAANRVVTGLAVNAASASARAPQSILVAVSPDGARWTRDSLVDVVRETFDLARARLVTLEHTRGDARVLPAWYVRSWSLQGDKTLSFATLAGTSARYTALAYIREVAP